MNVVDHQIFRLAIPAIVTNITVPLLGLADLTIVGHMGSTAYIGAVAVGSMVFNVIYWVFGFLRMGTSGLTSQALGAGAPRAIVSLLRQSLTAAMAIALAMLIGQRGLLALAMLAMKPQADVAQAVDTYFSICIWGAPAMMGLYSLTGWFIGMQNTRIPMYVSIVQNVANLVASVALVYGAGMYIEGVAMGTLIAQWTGFLMAIYCLWRSHLLPVVPYGLRGDNDGGNQGFLHFFAVNRDIFLRTLFLVSVNLFFTSAGSRQGALTLSANTLLLTLFTITSFTIDGLAYAAEALGGRCCGAHDRAGFSLLVRRLFLWGGLSAVLFTLVYILGGGALLRLLTSDAPVVAEALRYLPWAAVIPLAGVSAFLLDGLFIGLTATRAMLWSSVLSALLFYAVYLVFTPLMANHALWMALIVYLSMRGIIQAVMLRRSSPVWRRFE